MNEILEKTIRSLKRNGFGAYYAENAQEALELVLGMIPKSKTIGMGASATNRQIGIPARLLQEGRVVVNPYADTILKDEGLCE